MKSIRMLGLCLVAAFAMSAVAAVSASAALPEYVKCEAVPARTGAYDANCTTKDSDTDGNFEKVPVTSPVALTATSGTSMLDEGESGTKISCHKSKSTGAIGPKTEESVTTFEGCEPKALVNHCQNNGSKEGEIKTNPLNSELGFINKAKKEVGHDFTPKAGTVLAEFECGGQGRGPNFVFVEGSVIGKVTPVNKMTTSTTLLLKGAKGKQTPENFEGMPKDTLITKICTPECTSEGSAQIQTATITTAEAVEVLADEKISP